MSGGLAVRQERDAVRARLVIACAAVALVVLVVAVWVAARILKRGSADARAGADALSPGPRAARVLGAIDQTLASQPSDARLQRAAQEELLRTYGWTDREAGLARVPVEEAILVYVASQQDGGR